MNVGHSADRRRAAALLQLVVTAVIVETALAVLAWLKPVVAALFRPVYVIVALGFAFMAWRAFRTRSGSDRRENDRRVVESDQDKTERVGMGRDPGRDSASSTR